MKNILEEFRYRRSFVSNLNNDEANARLSGFLDWLESNETTATILSEIKNDAKVAEMLKKADFRTPPSASSPEDFALIGLHFMREVKSGKPFWGFSNTYGIHPSYSTTSVQAMVDEIANRYIEPALNYIERKLVEVVENNGDQESGLTYGVELENYPLEIKISLQKFREDHSSDHDIAFIMMPFGKTKAHQSIVESIKGVFDRYGIVALRADDKDYHHNLLNNVLTYIYGCTIGVAVFDRIETDETNPNVSFEVGYMRALNKPVCLLKDKTMNTLQTDLLGELYKSFDPQDPKNTVPIELEKWLRDRDIIF